MKRVVKIGAPRQYTDWVRRMRGQNNEDYRALQNPEKDFLQNRLLEEQGFLCGYTMKRISKTTSHIEHIKPESLCRIDEIGSDLEYRNLLACFPKDGMLVHNRYGAQAKDDWWENNGRDFISPLVTNCESYFKFNLLGEISSVRNNVKATKTISVLKLDNNSLTDDRKRAITEFLYGSDQVSPISQKEAERSLQAITNKNEEGSFVEFCVAIQHGLNEYLKLIKKESLKKKHIAKAKKVKKRK